MRCRQRWFLRLAWCLVAIGFLPGPGRTAAAEEGTARAPQIHPDYAGITLPPNIAPLNFSIREPGVEFTVELSASKGSPIKVRSRNRKIELPAKAWKDLLGSNRGGELRLAIQARDKIGAWSRFQVVTNFIAAEDIDPVLVYRKIRAAHSTWSSMGLFQRELGTFDEQPFLENRRFANDCSHCHALHGGNPDKATVVIRSSHFGNRMLVLTDGQAQAVEGSVGFVSWHPSTNILASSFSKPRLMLHSVRNDMRDIAELQGWIGWFRAGEEKVQPVPGLADPTRLYTFPAWSPDGRFLYYCTAPNPWTNMASITPTSHTTAKYDLMRTAYDPATGAWGPLELIVSAAALDASVAQPRISPDGRWIFFCAPQYGCWPTYDVTSDIYSVDLAAGATNGVYPVRKLELNSPACESWLSWSSNSRWVVFSSKRMSPLYNRPHLAYVRPDGTCGKPLVVPQQDPEYYDSLLRTYTIPTLGTGRIAVPQKDLVRAITGPAARKMVMPEAKIGDTSR